MPKMKSHSGAKKRLTLTGSGKVKRFQANTSHRFWGKSRKAKNRHVGSTITNPADEGRAKRMLAVG